MARAASRFYSAATAAAAAGGYGVFLDGRALKTPGKLPFITRSEVHARLAASEWEAQGEEIKPQTMPITRLYNVAIERAPQQRGAMIAEFKKYGGTDLLCYRAAEPLALRERQAKAWDPWLVWARGQGIDLKTADSVMAITQAPKSLDNLADFARAMDDFELTLLLHFMAVFGSAVLALAVLQGALPAPQAYELSRLDAQFQAEHWGVDEEAENITAQTRREVEVLSRLL
jgi:chaperone required for assembly of F1-ATPase